MNYTTPGVVVEEISTFPPSVVAVETAVPAFIGYTESAQDEDGSNLTRVSKRITSFLEFERFFGGSFDPATYRVVIDIANANAVGAVTARDASGAVRRYHLHTAMRQHYANGGGSCFVVSVGAFPAEVELGTDSTGLQGGLAPIRNMDAPTLLVVPDAVSLDSGDRGGLQQAMLEQCAELQDRFAILDLATNADADQDFRNNISSSNLRYGAAYHPWLQTIYRPNVAFRQLSLVNDGGTALTAAQIDTLTSDTETNELVVNVRSSDAQVQQVVDAVDLSGFTDDAPITLTRANFREMSAHIQTMTEAIRALDAAATENEVRGPFGNLMTFVRGLALGLPAVVGAGLDEPEIDELASSFALNAETNGLQARITSLIAYEKNAAVLPLVAADRDAEAVNEDYPGLDDTDWIAAATVADITPDTDAVPGTTPRERALSAAAQVSQFADRLAASMAALFDAAVFLAERAEKLLFDGHPVFQAIRDRVQTFMSLVPPSGAVAGVYGAIDRTRGVWVAPANVSLNEVVGPVVKVNDADQGRLNVHSTGKSINAIRSFTGRGTLIWGARTLAGNDNEWRYVPVRRFFNMAEESIKKATEPFVFEPNNANTWVRVRAMIENFLTVQWRQGALQGATPQSAFFVRVGLGVTMTAEDILNGLMKVEIGLAVVRPAEFIILKFAHKMQVS